MGNRTHLLDPVSYRMDAILRRPYTTQTPFATRGQWIQVASPAGWGFPDGVTVDGEIRLQPLRFLIRADEETILPGESLFRPSHITLHGVGRSVPLQVTEDKFVTSDDVLISRLALRNSGEEPIPVTVEPLWNLGSDSAFSTRFGTITAYRGGPPGDDLRFRLSPSSHRTLFFAVGFAESREAARLRVASWQWDSDPVGTHAGTYQDWFDRNAPGFDCSDPFVTRLWYHHWQQVRWQAVPAGRLSSDVSAFTLPTNLPTEPEARFAFITRLARSEFQNGDFDVPQTTTTAWATLILTRLLGIIPRRDNVFAVEPFLLPHHWSHFCLENLPYQGQRITLVWDNPALSDDAYYDGDKGLTVYVNGRPAFHQSTLTAFSFALTPFLSAPET